MTCKTEYYIYIFWEPIIRRLLDYWIKALRQLIMHCSGLKVRQKGFWKKKREKITEIFIDKLRINIV